MDIPSSSGGIGLGTWKNSAEFKDLKVTTPKGKVLYQNNFSSSIDDWEMLGNGEWNVSNGVLSQNSLATEVTAFVGNDNWREYVVILKARKLSGEVCASAQKDEKSGDIIVKVVNAGNKDLTTKVLLNGIGKVADLAKATVLSSGSSLDENSLDVPTKVVPHKEQVRINGNHLVHKFPANSVTVFRISKK